MISLDTNVLVRYVVHDDTVQFSRAERLIDSAAARDEQLFVSLLTACELVWVLGSAYRFSRDRVAEVLNGLILSQHVVLEDRDLLRDALAAYREGRGDFADYVIRERSLAAGCEAVATFDSALAGESGFVEP